MSTYPNKLEASMTFVRSIFKSSNTIKTEVYSLTFKLEDSVTLVGEFQHVVIHCSE